MAASTVGEGDDVVVVDRETLGTLSEFETTCSVPFRRWSSDATRCACRRTSDDEDEDDHPLLGGGQPTSGGSNCCGCWWFWYNTDGAPINDENGGCWVTNADVVEAAKNRLKATTHTPRADMWRESTDRFVWLGDVVLESNCDDMSIILCLFCCYIVGVVLQFFLISCCAKKTSCWQCLCC